METIQVTLLLLVTYLTISTELPLSQDYSGTTNSSYIRNETETAEMDSSEEKTFRDVLQPLLRKIKEGPAHNLTSYDDSQLSEDDSEEISLENLATEGSRQKREAKKPLTNRPKRNYRHNPVLVGK